MNDKLEERTYLRVTEQWTIPRFWSSCVSACLLPSPLHDR